MLKKRIEAWIINDIGLTEMDNWNQVMRFALRLAMRVTAVAVVMVSCILLAMDKLGWLIIPLPRGLLIGTGIASVVGFNLTMICSVYLGHAVVHMARTRLEFQQLSRTDMLSGLLNRRAFIDEVMATERGHLLIIDIDRFKQINDRYGHIAGDDVIRNIARLFLTAIEPPHRLARIGGEEFAILLIGLDQAEAIATAERLRRCVATTPVDVQNHTITVTLSGGLADLTPLRDFSAAYAAADKALYFAKAGGRNRMHHESEIRHYILDQEPPLFPGAGILDLAVAAQSS
ncbi:GGDEF domain-containing protein [Peteryoungia ipomoeae]|uniref:diguanylate cyclase n=1 Tax=Peteryoungia ipomoeae TaxID=1210932 RepID=A0A4S8P475_9HYPH|nr:GGDEF domain-containing protein [Peteryoungia ipomoeae]THV24847.1 GGDEF domain-containing protein [Peteryoungia ipomoeae]